jgi:hypothetical protein
MRGCFGGCFGSGLVPADHTELTREEVRGGRRRLAGIAGRQHDVARGPVGGLHGRSRAHHLPCHAGPAAQGALREVDRAERWQAHRARCGHSLHSLPTRAAQRPAGCCLAHWLLTGPPLPGLHMCFPCCRMGTGRHAVPGAGMGHLLPVRLPAGIFARADTRNNNRRVYPKVQAGVIEGQGRPKPCGGLG